MKRLALALAVISIVACKKGEEAQPAADTTAAHPQGPRQREVFWSSGAGIGSPSSVFRKATTG